MSDHRAGAAVATPAAPLLEVRDLTVSFETLRGRVRVIDDVGFTIREGEVVGLVGESGSGKSVTAMSLMRLLGEQGRVERGRVRLGDRDLLSLSDTEILSVRGREIAMIFQEPMTSLNPVYTVGFQIVEVLMEHFGQPRRAALARAVELMTLVGIPAAEQRVREFPHQLSGGMRQRVMIAMAMACQPRLLIADEPTTALDVTIQAQILNLMRELKRRFGTAVLLITHDLGVVASMADRVMVMYGGQIVESGEMGRVFGAPRHPYTRLLLQSIPRVREKRPTLSAIPGSAPSPSAFPSGCRFHPRCPDATDECRVSAPTLEAVDRRVVRCWRASEEGLRSAEPA